MVFFPSWSSFRNTFVCICRVLYSAVSGVKRVYVVISGLRMRSFVCAHVCISCRYDCRFVFAMFMSVGVDGHGDIICVSFTGVCGIVECQMCIC